MIIPMIDIMFFLLVFFMMSSLSMVDMHSLGVQLPVAADASEAPSSQYAVTLKTDGTLWLNGNAVDREALMASARARQAEDKSFSVILYADKAVLISQLLKTLPFTVFATSSIDALVHAVESALSPDSSASFRVFSYQAIERILSGYLQIRDHGPEARIPLMKDFLLASTWAGIAFSVPGCAAVHAMSYPLGANYHVPHGESNYAMFTGVMKHYMTIKSDGEIARLNAFIAGILGCDAKAVYDELEKLLNVVLPKKALHEYGVKEEELAEFAKSVMENQGRLMAHNFVPLTYDDVYEIYKSLY